MRMRAKKDDNHKEIAAVFKACGASVTDTSMVGNGVPDIIVGFPGVNYLIEIKDGKKPPSARKLTPDEQAFHLEWKGPIAIITSVDDALALIKSVARAR